MKIQEKAVQAVSQLMSLNMLMWLTMLILFAAIACLAAAGYMALATVLAPALAALFTGLGLLLLVAVLVITIRTAIRSAATASEPTKPRTDDDTQRHRGDTSAHSTVQWVENNHDIAIAAALAAGIALAASSGLRRTLVRAAGPVLVRSVGRIMKKYLE